MSPNIGQGTSMALEDTVLLSRLLQDGDNLSTVFKKFDDIRRPRIKEFFTMAGHSGDMRRVTGPWAQWIKEWVMWFGLKIMPESWTTAPFEYDVFSVSLDTPV
jgi:2-polyprenyl-6-methoxyphenol hydroxylase-like FAD-dependent oxidoreductase